MLSGNRCPASLRSVLYSKFNTVGSHWSLQQYVLNWILIRHLRKHTSVVYLYLSKSCCTSSSTWHNLISMYSYFWHCTIIEWSLHAKLRRRGSWVFVCRVTSLNATHHETSTVSNSCFRVQHRPPLSLLVETALLICSRHWNWTLSFNTNTRHVRGCQKRDQFSLFFFFNWIFMTMQYGSYSELSIVGTSMYMLTV